MPWNLMLVFGALFIANGVFIMMHAKQLEDIRKKIPNGIKIFSGTSKGILFLVSTDVMIGVEKNGVIKEAFSIKSGWLRKSSVEELSSLKGLKIMSLFHMEDTLTVPQSKACRMAAKRYQLLTKQ